MSAGEDDFLRSLRETFKIEANEHVEAMAASLLELEKVPGREEQGRLVEAIFRAAHSLKGAARAVNSTEVEGICQKLEDQFSRWKRGEMAPSGQSLDEVHQALDRVTRILGDGSRVETGAVAHAEVRVPVYVTETGGPQSAGAVGQAQFSDQPNPPLPSSVGVERLPGGETIRISAAKLDARLLEAEEMLTAKLAARQRAAELSELAGHLEGWTKHWASLQPEIRALRHRIQRQAPEAPSGLDRVMEFVDWNEDYLRSLRAKVAGLSRTAELDRQMVGKLVDDLLEDSKKLLMLPLSTMGALFPRVVRDLCREQGKEAELVIEGEDVELDKRILEEMKDPIIHLLRNSVDHGVEKPAERKRVGKPERATIAIKVSPVNGNKVELTVSDDGGGINVEAVRKAAVQKGVILAEEAAALDDEAALELIFRSDVSTSPMITRVSGRGLGLAIVRENAEKLGGRISLENRPGQGTAIRITLPVALATFRGILIEVGGRQFVVPTIQVERVIRYRPADVQTVENRETLSLDGRAISLVRMEDVLEMTPMEQKNGADCFTAMLLGSGEQRIAFALDAVLDEQEVLVKRLARPLVRVRNIAGVTVLGNGQVAPILNVADLLKSARRAGIARSAKSEMEKAASVATKSAEPSSKQISILVAEDSITSRMLLKGILEAAGYAVKTAVDGMEAYANLREGDYDLVISDVEMPRLNGFDLTARIRADRKLEKLPVILVTALETREDRERGIDAGANAYVVKSNFDQSNLLEIIRRLV